MEKLFYKDPYIKKFSANIIETEIIDDNINVVLDKTAFFPGGGGQFADLGFIDDIEVLDVFTKDNKIYHTLKSISKKTFVYCEIDWKRRFDGMVQHLAQHVLSGCFYKVLGKNTNGFHLGRDFSTVDIVGDVSQEELLRIEKVANSAIKHNLNVDVYTPSKDNLNNLNLRRDLPITEDDISIVEIENLDINACCGVHPKSTLELRMIKFRKSEKNRGSTRIEYLAGDRAVNYLLDRDNYLNDVCKTLKCTDKEATNFINNINLKLNENKDKINSLENEIMENEIKLLTKSFEIIDEKKVIKKEFIEKDISYIKKLAQKITTEDNFLCFFKLGNIFIVSSSTNLDFDSNLYIKSILKITSGKGGGNKYLAQALLNDDICLERIKI